MLETITTEKPYVHRIVVEHIFDQSPDLSFLTEHAAGDEYAEQDNERIAAYERGDWYMMGVGAKATIYIPGVYDKMLFSFELTSMGLWGIESDSDKEYIQEVENEELDCIKEQLKRLNIELPANFQVEHVERDF